MLVSLHLFRQCSKYSFDCSESKISLGLVNQLCNMKEIPFSNFDAKFSCHSNQIKYLKGLVCAGPCIIPTQFNTIYSDELYQYDPVKTKWTELTRSIASPLPAGRCGMGLAASEGRLLVFAGCTNAREFDQHLKCIHLPMLLRSQQIQRSWIRVTWQHF